MAFASALEDDLFFFSFDEATRTRSKVAFFGNCSQRWMRGTDKQNRYNKEGMYPLTKAQQHTRYDGALAWCNPFVPKQNKTDANAKLFAECMQHTFNLLISQTAAVHSHASSYYCDKLLEYSATLQAHLVTLLERCALVRAKDGMQERRVT